MVAEKSPLTFYFDFISPFAYLGWKQVHDLAARNERPLVITPVLFAALLNEHGHLGPAEIPPKRIYTWKYAARLAHDLGVPLQPPPAHPFNPLLALRLASLPLESADRKTLIDRLFDMVWATREGATDPARIAEALTAVGLPGERLVNDAHEPPAKDRVKTQTAAALAAGVFGVPTVIVDGELFWGQDAFGHIDRFLQGRDPVDPADASAWVDLPAGAKRTPRPPQRD